MGLHEVHITPIPPWIPAPRLLGPGDWRPEGLGWRASLEGRAAADLEARLHGVVLDGSSVVFAAAPGLPRPLVRAARTDEARRRRDSTPGFTRPGARTDEEGRYSLTPEVQALALGQAARARFGPQARVLDAGCGVGGNSVGFARAGLTVVAVDRDPGRLALARHNARVYGVEPRITFVAGDAVEAARGAFDLVFTDPPWGPDYRLPHGLEALPLLAALRDRPAVWAKVAPAFRTADLDGWTAEAIFGEAAGDARRVKWVLMKGPGPTS
jgi:SAM-dependent methyltransferase